MFGKKKRIIAEQQKQIEALTSEIERLTKENQAFSSRVAEIERRESGIGRAISEATATADSLIESAQRKAGALLEQTQADCDAAKRDAEILVDDAYRNARDIVKEAETTGQQKLDEVDAQINQYATLLNAYDSLVQEQMQQAQDNAKRFYELSKALHDTVPQILAADGTLLIPEPEEETPCETAQTTEQLEEHLWTVDEVADPVSDDNEAQVDTIIEDILRASREQNRE